MGDKFLLGNEFLFIFIKIRKIRKRKNNPIRIFFAS